MKNFTAQEYSEEYKARNLKLGEALRARWKDPKFRKAQRSKIPNYVRYDGVEIDGVMYPSISEASRSTGLSPFKIKKYYIHGEENLEDLQRRLYEAMDRLPAPRYSCLAIPCTLYDIEFQSGVYAVKVFREAQIRLPGGVKGIRATNRESK